MHRPSRRQSPAVSPRLTWRCSRLTNRKQPKEAILSWTLPVTGSSRFQNRPSSTCCRVERANLRASKGRANGDSAFFCLGAFPTHNPGVWARTFPAKSSRSGVREITPQSAPQDPAMPEPHEVLVKEPASHQVTEQV